jgi:hypothetical protein
MDGCVQFLGTMASAGVSVLLPSFLGRQIKVKQFTMSAASAAPM